MVTLDQVFDDLGDVEIDDLLDTSRETVPAVTGKEPPVMRRKNGEPEATAHNAIIYLNRANERRGLGIRHNLFTGQDEWKAGEIRDGDLTLIRVEIERVGMHNVGSELTARAVRAVAERNARHPIRDWLGGLQHEGKPRLSTWLADYLGAEAAPYTEAVARVSLIGLVARAMRPGCKHDHVLCLTGSQGVPAMQFAYLSSTQGVQIQRTKAWDTLGLKFRAFLDFGAGWLDWRGAYLNDGAS